jgi:hypothetical protein
MVRHDAGPRIKDSLLGFSVSRKDLVASLHQLYVTIGNRFWKWSKESPPQGTWARWHLHLLPYYDPRQFSSFLFSLVSCKEIRFSSQLLRAFQKIYKVVTFPQVLPQFSLSALQQSFKTSPWKASNIMHVPNRKLHPIREIRNR